MPRKKATTSTAAAAEAQPQEPVSYGELLAKAQWDTRIWKECSLMPDYELDVIPRWNTSHFRNPQTYQTIRNELASRTRRRFRFAPLPLALQTEVIEWLGYADLKAFELASKATERLVSQSSQILDAKLFRRKLDLDALRAAASASDQAKEAKLPVTLHPILEWKSLMLELRYRWASVPFNFASLDVRRSGKPRLLRNVKEIAENATEPPCNLVKLTVWGGQDWKEHIFDNRPNGQCGTPFHFTVKAKSAGQALTVEDLMKGLLDAFKSIQHDMRDTTQGYGKWDRPIVFNPTFKGGFETQYIDESGCLHLLDSRFRLREYEDESTDWAITDWDGRDAAMGAFY